DADVCVHADTLARIDAYLRQHPETVAVMGSYDDQPSEPSFVSQYRNLFHHLIHQSSASHASTFWAGCGAIRREVFVASGGFDESYSRPCIEDIELGARLAAAGHRLALEPTIQVTHLKRWTLASVVRTDLFDRAAPWIALMLRQGSMPADLNVTAVHRVSVVLAWLLLFGTVALIAAASTASAAALWAVLSMWVPIATALLLLNFEVYRFFAAKRGLWFAIRSVAMHWLYYFYCGLGVILGVWQYLRAPVTLPASRQQVS
ncbi:MAG TPA: glycosyltransferase, partial [Terriglobales bacterium]|nr:glycosyltransferase [Terriglobales bacterium]